MGVIKIKDINYSGVGTASEVDTTIIEGSNNAVSGGAVYDAMSEKASDIAINKSTLGYKCKNLLTYPYLYTTRTIQDVDWIDNGDGTVTVSGTNTDTTALSIFNCVTRLDTTMPLFLEAGTYILNGCPSGGSNSTYCIQVGRTKNEAFDRLGYDYGEGITFTLEETTQIQVQLMVGIGATVDNITFKPMIRLADIDNDTFEAYTPSVDTRLDAIESDVSTLKTSVVNKGDLLVPYQEINSSNVITYTDTTYNWLEYKGFVLGLQVIGNDNSVWVETRYIPANFVSLSTTAKHGISIQQIDYRADAYVQINVNTNTLLAFNSNLTSFIKPNIFLYGVK